MNDLSMFSFLADKQPFDVDIIAGKYVGNGKSLINLIALNILQRDADVALHGTEEENDAFIAELQNKGIMIMNNHRKEDN